jgi:hypothetical protein
MVNSLLLTEHTVPWANKEGEVARILEYKLRNIYFGDRGGGSRLLY